MKIFAPGQLENDPEIMVLPFRARDYLEQEAYDRTEVIGYSVRHEAGEIWFVLRVPDEADRIFLSLRWPTEPVARLREYFA